MPTGVINFSRRQAKFPAWECSSAIFTKVHATSEGTIEDKGQGMLQVCIIIKAGYCLCNSVTL